MAEAPEVGSNTTGSGIFEYEYASFTVTVNRAPTISDITDQTTDEDIPSVDIPFTIGDVETQVDDLTVSASSANTTLAPDANIVFGDSGENRALTVTPTAGKTGAATITAGVSDGTVKATDTFVITVEDTIAPTVTNVAPAGKKVSRRAMVRVTFSEAMNEASVEAPGTFTLNKGAPGWPSRQQ